MGSSFYTVRFQFPLLWKTFFTLVITLLVLTFFVSDFRKAVYQALPVKTAAIILNSDQFKEPGGSTVDIFTGAEDRAYIVSKYGIYRILDNSLEEEISSTQVRLLSNGKTQPLSCGAEINGRLYAGTWYGSLLLKGSKGWDNIYQHKDRNKILGIFHEGGKFYLPSYKGVIVLDSQFKWLKTELDTEKVMECEVINNRLLILTSAAIFELNHGSFKKIYDRSKNVKIHKLAQFNGNPVLLTSNGLVIVDKKINTISNELEGHFITDYFNNGEVEIATANKEGLFLRKKDQKWIQFPSPAKAKARSSGIFYKNGCLWIPFYGSGLYKIDCLRLLELEGQL